MFFSESSVSKHTKKPKAMAKLIITGDNTYRPLFTLI